MVVLRLEKGATHVVSRTTSNQNVLGKGLVGPMVEKGQIGPKEIDKCTHRCNIYEINEDCHDDDNSIGDLTDQVQSLFYSLKLN